MQKAYLDFEKPLENLEKKLEELRRYSNGQGPPPEARELEDKLRSLRKDIFSSLTAWQKTQLARHPERPYTLDYIQLIAEDFIELHGDRRFGDDRAIVGGLASIQGQCFVVIGHQKGRSLKERVERNFGQPHPEGYRKALRLMKLAERFGKPVLTFIDTPGAYPGIGAEERGQAEAIATNLMEMSLLKVPIISVVIGEGGSGGALALSVADRLYMLQYSIYSVISPEGCAAILWKRDSEQIGQREYAMAAEALKLTAEDLKALGIIDDIIAEPEGGAHRDPAEAAGAIKERILQDYEQLKTLPVEELLTRRYERLRRIGRLQDGKR